MVIVARGGSTPIDPNGAAVQRQGWYPLWLSFGVPAYRSTGSFGATRSGRRMSLQGRLREFAGPSSGHSMAQATPDRHGRLEGLKYSSNRSLISAPRRCLADRIVADILDLRALRRQRMPAHESAAAAGMGKRRRGEVSTKCQRDSWTKRQECCPNERQVTDLPSNASSLLAQRSDS